MTGRPSCASPSLRLQRPLRWGATARYPEYCYLTTVSGFWITLNVYPSSMRNGLGCDHRTTQLRSKCGTFPVFYILLSHLTLGTGHTITTYNSRHVVTRSDIEEVRTQYRSSRSPVRVIADDSSSVRKIDQSATQLAVTPMVHTVFYITTPPFCCMYQRHTERQPNACRNDCLKSYTFHKTFL